MVFKTNFAAPISEAEPPITLPRGDDMRRSARSAENTLAVFTFELHIHELSPLHALLWADVAALQ